MRMRLREIEWEHGPELWERGHHGPTRLITVRARRFSGKALAPGSGREDSVYTFQTPGFPGSLYVLSLNRRLGYAGLAEFSAEDKPVAPPAVGDSVPVLRPARECFFQADMDEVIGPKGLDYEPITIAKRLADFLGD